MERRGQNRDIAGGGIPNTISYNPPPQLSHESPVKLPLAPIVSTPSDRRGNTTASTRRGSAIFSPTSQTLDHHNLNHYQPPPQPPPPPPPPLVQKEPTPDPDPTHFPPSTAAASFSKNHPSPPSSHQQQLAVVPVADPGSIRYRECLKNHAASMGGHVVDGCGEFMPGGDEGTPESLRCAACDCHRNFHRREVDGEQSNYYTYNPTSNNSSHHRHPTLHGQTPSPLPPQKHSHSFSQGFAAAGPTQPTMVNFGGNSGGAGAVAESSSEDLNMFQSSDGGHAVMQPSFSGSRKRFRTKFSQEQKERMQEFATRIGWRIQKQDEQEVIQFCNEIGLKRQVFKVWMHNNKQAMKKKQM